jgi:hypothetical protein
LLFSTTFSHSRKNASAFAGLAGGHGAHLGSYNARDLNPSLERSQEAGVIVGLNRIVEHEGRQLHIQVEDLGEEHACFEVRLHERGAVLWSKRVGYAETLAQGLPKADQDEAIRSTMEKTLHTVAAAIARGKLP